MTDAAHALQYVQAGVFVVVAVVATAGWVRRRGAPRAWLAATFVLLGTVSLSGVLLPDHPTGTGDQVALRAVLGLFVLFPYALFRFMASFERPPRRLEHLAHVVLGAAVVATLALPRLTGETEGPRPIRVWAFVVAALVEWTSLCGIVTVRLWRAGRGQPTVTRRRLRLLASGAGALAFALVVALTAPSGDDVTAATLLVDALAIGSAVLFLAGFAPPPWVLRAWRARDFEAIQTSFVALAGATSPAEVVDELLPRVVALVGAQGAAIRGADGSLLGRTGVVRSRRYGTEVTLAPGVTQYGPDHLGVAAPGGRLELFTSAYTPYFGRDDLALLRNVAALVHTTLERTYAHAREVAAREALDEAQRIAHLGSWRLDLATGAVVASDELYRLHGLAPQSERLTRDRMVELVHPDDRGDDAPMEEAVATGGDFTNEYRVVLPDGTVRWLAARGSALRDDTGAVVALLGTCQDVTEARRLDRMRSEFVANAAHELRTPLTTVSAMATLLAAQRERLGPAELDRAFAALGRQGERARTLVTNLLDLSRLEAGRVPVQLRPTPLARVVAAALETAPPPAHAAVAVDVAPGLAAAADPDRLHEVVVNLLTNAYRYGGPGIAVTAHADACGVRLVVSDDGAGVPEDFVPELFEPFSRAADVTGTPGSGLGLAISHRLASALGGGLSYERADGRSRFVVRLRTAR